MSIVGHGRPAGGRAGHVTIRDIARAAGVHPSTVSRALDPLRAARISDDTRRQVTEAAEALGYTRDAVARGLRAGRTRTIGVVVADIANPFIAPVLRGIENGLGSRDLMALVTESRDDVDRLGRLVGDLLARRVDALIVTGARRGDERALRRAAQHIPVVLAVRSLERSPLPAVTHDDVQGGRLAAEHLLGLGHRRLAHLRGPDDVSSFRDRARGFRDSVLAAGGHLVGEHLRAGMPTLDDGRRMLRSMLDLHEAPTAVFALNDIMAIGAVQELRARGLECPADVSVVGYNDDRLAAHVVPALTTVRLPAYELGRIAADTAVTLIEDPAYVPARLALPSTLVVRDSTAAFLDPIACSQNQGGSA
jgi:LacI family transcriptional regulator